MTTREPRNNPGKWTPKGEKVQCVTTDAPEYFTVGKVYKIHCGGVMKSDDKNGWLSGSDATFIPYVPLDPDQATAVTLMEIRQAIADMSDRIDALELRGAKKKGAWVRGNPNSSKQDCKRRGSVWYVRLGEPQKDMNAPHVIEIDGEQYTVTYA